MINRFEIAGWQVALMGLALPLIAGGIASVVARDSVDVQLAEHADDPEDSLIEIAEVGGAGAQALRVTMGPEAMEARRRINELKRSDALSSTPNPFYYFVGEEQEFQLEEQPDIDTSVDLSGMQLTGVMGGRTPLAIINGEMLRINDTIDGGWILLEINPVERSVRLRGPGGQEHVLSADDD